jgi:hypothetical protein
MPVGDSRTFTVELGDAAMAVIESADTGVVTVNRDMLNSSGVITARGVSVGAADVNVTFYFDSFGSLRYDGTEEVLPPEDAVEPAMDVIDEALDEAEAEVLDILASSLTSDDFAYEEDEDSENSTHASAEFSMSMVRDPVVITIPVTVTRAGTSRPYRTRASATSTAIPPTAAQSAEQEPTELVPDEPMTAKYEPMQPIDPPGTGVSAAKSSHMLILGGEEIALDMRI